MLFEKGGISAKRIRLAGIFLLNLTRLAFANQNG
jgi:hypothetical protein